MTMKQFITLLFFASVLFSQEKIDVRFETDDGRVTIRYFLHGDPGKEYEVNTVIRKQSDPGFSLKPAETTGDVGKGRYAGKERLITWKVTKEEEDRLGEDEFFIEITAEEISTGSSWYWYALGAAAVGGGAAAYLLLKKDDKGTAAVPDVVASPPGRP